MPLLFNNRTGCVMLCDDKQPTPKPTPKPSLGSGVDQFSRGVYSISVKDTFTEYINITNLSIDVEIDISFDSLYITIVNDPLYYTTQESCSSPPTPEGKCPTFTGVIYFGKSESDASNYGGDISIYRLQQLKFVRKKINNHLEYKDASTNIVFVLVLKKSYDPYQP